MKIGRRGCASSSSVHMTLFPSRQTHSSCCHSHLQKEMKRLAKAQQMAGIVPGAPPGNPTSSVPVPAGTPAAPLHPPVARSNTPRPGSGVAARPTVPTPTPNLNQPPRGATPVGVGTPRSVSTPSATTVSHPASTLAGSTSAPVQLHAQATMPAQQTPAVTNGQDVKRGVKREREDSVSSTGVRTVNGNLDPVPASGGGGGGGAAGGGKPYAMPPGAKAGMNGIRPRPVKKPRVVS